MKISSTLSRIVAILFLIGGHVFAQTIVKSNTTSWDTASDWGGTAPTSGNIGQFDGTITLTDEGNMTLGGNVSLGGLVFTNLLNGAVMVNADGNTLTIGASGIDMSAANKNVTFENLIALGAGQTWTVASGITLRVDGVISGGNSLTKSGAGILTLSATNTYSGGTFITQGTVDVIGNNGTSAAFGTGAINLGATSGSNSATFQITANSTIITNAINVVAGSTGTLTIGGPSGFDTFSGAVTLANNLTVSSTGSGSMAFTGGVTGTGDLILNSTHGSISLQTVAVNMTGSITATEATGFTLTISSVIGSNVTGLTDTGPGTLTLSGVNSSYTGGLVINSGLVNAQTTTAIGTGAISIASGGTLDLNAGGAVYTNSFSGAGVINIVGTATPQFNTAGQFSSFSGTLNIASDTTSNKLVIGISTPNTMTITLADASTVFLSGSANTFASTIDVGGGGNTENFGAIRLDSGTISGNILLTDNNSGTGVTIGHAGGATNVISGVISDGGNGFGISSASASTGGIELSGANTFSGATNWSNSNETLNLGNSLALQDSTLNYTTATAGKVVFNNSVSSNAFTFGGLSGTTNLSLVNSASGAVALSVGNNNASTSYSGVLSGSGGLTKIGTGSLTLSSTPTYTGATTVNAGKLVISNGTLNATSQVTINGGSLLFGSGTSGTTTNVNLNSGGTLGFTTQAAGTKLIAGSLTLASNGNAIIDFGAGGSGNNTLNFTALFGLTSTSTISVYDYTLGNFSLTPTGSLQTYSSGTNDHLLFNSSTGIGNSGSTEVLFYSDSGSTLIGEGYEVMFGSQYEIVPVIPEPSTYAVALGLLGLLSYRLREWTPRFGS